MSNVISPTVPVAVATQPASPTAVKAVQPVRAVLGSTTPEPERAAVTAAAMELQARAQTMSASLEFKVDDATRRTVITVRDTETGDVIRQIPSEEALHLARQLVAHPSAILSKEA